MSARDQQQVERCAAEALAIHDGLELRGFSHSEIIAIFGAGMSYSLIQLSPEDQAVQIAAHLFALAEFGIEIDGDDRILVRSQ